MPAIATLKSQHFWGKLPAAGAAATNANEANVCMPLKAHTLKSQGPLQQRINPNFMNLQHREAYEPVTDVPNPKTPNPWNMLG